MVDPGLRPAGMTLRVTLRVDFSIDIRYMLHSVNIPESNDGLVDGGTLKFLATVSFGGGTSARLYAGHRYRHGA